MNRLRVASLQYYIRPVRTFEAFQDQVEALVETAADYRSQLLVFPEYFTTQLLTLGDTRRPIDAQIRDLAAQRPRFVELMTRLARTHGIHIAAGTIPEVDPDTGKIHNDAYFISPAGKIGIQGKLHMTRFEREEWNVSAREVLKVFDTSLGRFAIAICYDVQFPEIIRAAARAGVDVLVVPSCTDDRRGYLRVRYCAQARAIENQMYVVHSTTVGSLPAVPAVSLNYGQAAIYTPSDFAFARDGILAQGEPNQESMVIGDLDMEIIGQARRRGTVLPLSDSERSLEIAGSLTREVL
ncbi:MAG: acyltransferase [Gemmatimonadales bacterium]|nr:MAG: acyltransferase [Gemmatimonadales bacterium]